MFWSIIKIYYLYFKLILPLIRLLPDIFNINFSLKDVLGEKCSFSYELEFTRVGRFIIRNIFFFSSEMVWVTKRVSEITINFFLGLAPIPISVGKVRSLP